MLRQAQRTGIRENPFVHCITDMARHQNGQPAFDFFTGAESQAPRQPMVESLKQSTTVRAGVNNEGLRAQLNTLQYELDSLKQDRELITLQHQQDLRDAQSRSESDFKRAEAAEASKNAATKRTEKATRDWQEAQDRATNEKAVLERKLREVQEDNRSLREDLEESQSQVSEQERQNKHFCEALQQEHSVLQHSMQGIQQEFDGKVAALQSTQQKLLSRENEVGQLENEVLRLKTQVGDSDALGVVKKELSEQVAYIKKLEVTNRDHVAELKSFRKSQQSIEVVEEEKRALEAKLRMMDDLRRELSEVQLQKRILSDEKRGWTSYLESEAGGERDMRYETPEDMAKAFLRERVERLSLVDKLGSVQPELSVKDEEIQSLKSEKAKLRQEVEQLRTAGPTSVAAGSIGESKARARLERQKNLVAKEVDYLRAQLKAFEAEETEFNPDQIDEDRRQRVHELEDMIEQQRNEIETLTASLSQLELQQPLLPSPKKRSRDDDEDFDGRLSEMRQKTRALQTDLDRLQTRNQYLEADLEASASQITSLKESARTRVLELRSNPTAEIEAIKMVTLRTLREENGALLEQLEGRYPSTKVVPISSLENMRIQLDDARSQMAQHEKKTMRLKQIWGSKSLEFREAVCSVLGWKLDFMPNGRVKAASILYPSLINNGEEEENSIVFDGENGTMKISGGPQSVFANEIKGLIEFWVEGRKEIPCFLAACTLEFYERRAASQ